MMVILIMGPLNMLIVHVLIYSESELYAVHPALTEIDTHIGDGHIKPLFETVVRQFSLFFT